MRIAIVTDAYPPRIGGTQTYNREYAARLHRRGHEVSVLRLVVADRKSPPDAFEVMNLRARKEDGRIVAAGLEAALAERRPDVALVSGMTEKLPRVVETTAQLAPVVYVVHDFGRRARAGWYRRRRRLRRFAFDRCAAFVANGRGTRERLIGAGVDADRVSLVSPGVDLERFHPDAEAGLRLREELGLGERPLILTVAKLNGRKGQARMIRAVSRLRKEFPDIAYVAAGEGSELAALERMVAELDLADAVRFPGAVEDVLPLFQACDVFAMPSYVPGKPEIVVEGLGIAYLEAAACGKPVIASANGGGAEIVAHGESGFLVDPEDSCALEEALGSLLRDPNLRRSFGERGRSDVERFSWDAGAEELERVLRDVAR